jgi:hypothetical protein
MEAQPLKMGVTDLGDPSIFTCPECHGSLLRMKTGGGLGSGVIPVTLSRLPRCFRN